MPQLDKLLAHVTPRGGIGLLLEPDHQPMLQMAGGGDLALLPNTFPSTMIEMLARELLPHYLEETWNTRGEASFRPRRRRRIRSASPSPGTPRASASRPRALARTAAALAPPPPPAHAQLPSLPPSQPPPALAVPGAPPLDPRPCSRSCWPGRGRISTAAPSRPPSAGSTGTWRTSWISASWAPTSCWRSWRAIAPAQSWSRYQEHHDADFAYPYETGHCRLRVNYFVDRMGPGFVCRVIPNEIPDPGRLGLDPAIQRLALLPKGLVLVTGPTGSGKSTTLAAIIDHANRHRSDHILTIEDPIEFVHQRKRCLVNQREVGTHTESFKTGLRAALREDPDIVMVGEMRDLETIAIALETAVTGHLVFGTLHTSSAVGTIDRIVDQFPADRQQQIRVMLADSLKCVVSQILLKRVGGGRIAALESLFITPAISNLIREGKNFQIPSAMQTGRAFGQKLMNDALIELIQSGRVEKKEAYLRAPDKETFMAALKRADIDWDPRLQAGALA